MEACYNGRHEPRGAETNVARQDSSKWEERQGLRYEFDGVEPVAMTGGTVGHCAQFPGKLQQSLVWGKAEGKEETCRFGRATSRSGKSLTTTFVTRTAWSCTLAHPDPAAKVVRDPVVIFEVLSPSTAAKDRIVKAREYQATPSVKRYVMLEQERIGATVHVRAQDGWSVLVLKDDDTLDDAGNRPRDPARRILRRPCLRGPSVRGQRQRPAAAHHRLTGFNRSASRTPDAWARRREIPSARPLRPPSTVRHPVPMLYEERSSESRLDAGPPCPRSTVT